MGQHITVTLPRGILLPTPSGGRWIREVCLRQFDGHDERALAELSVKLPPHQSGLVLLEKVAHFEEIEEESEQKTPLILPQLSIGDRAALMLQVYRLEFGDTVDCVATCPKCTRNMSIELSAAKLLDVKYPEPTASYRIEADGYALQVRPLTAFDQHGLADVAAGQGDLEQALARSCIVYSDRPLPENLPDRITAAIESKLREIDPLSDIMLKLSCPECLHEFGASFDAEDFVLRKFRMIRGDLESEVHWLAFNYHWSESEILSLPIMRRKRYISLINSSLTGEKT